MIRDFIFWALGFRVKFVGDEMQLHIPRWALRLDPNLPDKLAERIKESARRGEWA